MPRAKRGRASACSTRIWREASSTPIRLTVAADEDAPKCARGQLSRLVVPKGRDEDGLAIKMEWVRHHDRYSDGKLADKDMPYWPATATSAFVIPQQERRLRASLIAGCLGCSGVSLLHQDSSDAFAQKTAAPKNKRVGVRRQARRV